MGAQSNKLLVYVPKPNGLPHIDFTHISLVSILWTSTNSAEPDQRPKAFDLVLHCILSEYILDIINYYPKAIRAIIDKGGKIPSGINPDYSETFK